MPAEVPADGAEQVPVKAPWQVPDVAPWQAPNVLPSWAASQEQTIGLTTLTAGLGGKRSVRLEATNPDSASPSQKERG